MDEFKLPEKFAHDPARFRLLKSGAVYDNQIGRIVANPGGGKYAVTTEKSVEMHARRKQVGIIAQMRALARAEGMELPDDIEMDELLSLAASGVEALYTHAIKTFLASKNIRGMGEIIPKLVAGFIETDSRVRPEMDTPQEMPTFFILMNQYVHQLQNVKDDNSKAVEGEIIEEPKGV